MMKWFKLSGLAGLVLLVVAVGLMMGSSPASANAGPHGNYTLTTSACGGCHRAHTAVSPYLVKADNIYDLCTSCHGGLVSTDVVHGQFQSTGAPLNGGGFEQAVVMSNYELGTPAASAAGPVTSSHTVADLPVVPSGGGTPTPASGSATAWGGASSGQGAGPGTLECTSCHNPHGSTNYRILNDTTGVANEWIPSNTDLLQWVQYQVLATRDDGPTYTFTIDSTNCPTTMPYVIGGAAVAVKTVMVPAPGIGSRCLARYTSGVFAYPTPSPAAAGATAVPDVTKGMNAFCGTCHKSYLTMSGSAYKFNSQNTPVPGTTFTPVPGMTNYPYIYPGTQDSLDGNGDIARYRHSVDRTASGGKEAMRFAALGNDPNPPGGIAYSALGCLTCHFAHGSAAAQTPAAGTGGFPPATTTPGPGGTPPAGPVGPDGPAGDSSLLFYSNRGVCISCHQTVGTPVPPTATATPP